MIRLHFLLLLLSLLPGTTAFGADKWVTIGDSLTKEYELEFPLLNPDNPAAWGERNWLELLSTHRSQQVDIGPLAVWPDSRLTGHEYNWAIPGTTTSEWEEILTATLLSNFGFVFIRNQLNGYLDDADRVVIFLGGNDLKNNYGTYYRGENPETFINTLVANVTVIVNHVRSRSSTVPIVLVNMPDVGVTPVVQEDKTDPNGRQLVTDLTNEVNTRLKALAAAEDIGFADIASLTAELTGPRRFVIAGAQFFKSVDPDALSNDPEYLFSPDGFHPNTTAQLLFANAIAQAFNERYPELTSVPLFSTEEMLTILGIEPDMSFAEWAAAYDVDASDMLSDSDNDGLSLLEEFAFGLDPRDASNADQAYNGLWTGERLEMHYTPRLMTSTYYTITPEFGTDLRAWTPVPGEDQALSEGQQQAWVSPHASPCFLRLSISAP